MIVKYVRKTLLLLIGISAAALFCLESHAKAPADIAIDIDASELDRDQKMSDTWCLGRKNGRLKAFYKKEVLAKKRRKKVFATCSNNNVEGKFTEYYKTGHLKRQGHFKNTRMVGTWYLAKRRSKKTAKGRKIVKGVPALIAAGEYGRGIYKGEYIDGNTKRPRVGTGVKVGVWREWKSQCTRAERKDSKKWVYSELDRIATKNKLDDKLSKRAMRKAVKKRLKFNIYAAKSLAIKKLLTLLLSQQNKT